MTTEKLVAAIGELAEYIDNGGVSAKAEWRNAVSRHALLPAPAAAPELRWPGVEVVQAEDGWWNVQTNTHWFHGGALKWLERSGNTDAKGGYFATRDLAISALNDPRTPPPPHVAEKPADGDDGMEERALKFLEPAPYGLYTAANAGWLARFAQAEVARATAAITTERDEARRHNEAASIEASGAYRTLAALTAERDRLAAELAKAKSERNAFDRECKRLRAALRAAKKPGQKKRKGAKRGK